MNRGREGGLEARIRALVEATCAAHAIEPHLHEIFTVWGPRLRFEPIETEVDAASPPRRRPGGE